MEKMNGIFASITTQLSPTTEVSQRSQISETSQDSLQELMDICCSNTSNISINCIKSCQTVFNQSRLLGRNTLRQFKLQEKYESECTNTAVVWNTNPASWGQDNLVSFSLHQPNQTCFSERFAAFWSSLNMKPNWRDNEGCYTVSMAKYH